MNEAEELVQRAQDGDESAVLGLRAIVIGYRTSDVETYSRALNRVELYADDSLEVPLLAALAEDALGCRMWAAAACGRLGIRSAEPLVIALLDDLVPMVRETACEVLGQLASSASVDPLARMLGDDQEAVRQAAGKALVAIGGDAATEHLWTAFESSPYASRHYLAENVGELGLVDRLVEAATADDADLRFWAARALARAHDDRAVPVLQALLDDRGLTRTGALVRTAARRALRRYTGPPASAVGRVVDDDGPPAPTGQPGIAHPGPGGAPVDVGGLDDSTPA